MGDVKEYIKSQKFHIIASNLPCIPRPKITDDNSYEGLSLPIYLIQNIDKILNNGGKLFLNLSSLSFPIMDEFLNNTDLKIKKLESMDVPLKMFNILNNKEWLDYFIQEKGFKKEMREGHKYLQTLHMYEIQKIPS